MRPALPKLIDRLQGERRGVEPLVRGRSCQGDALAGGVRTVVGDVGIGAVHAGGRIDRESGSPGHDGAQLPAAHHGIQEPIADVQLPPLAERQIVQSRDDQAMAIVEGRKPALAALAVAVLPEQRVAVGSADSAGLIDGFRPGVGNQGGDTVARSAWSTSTPSSCSCRSRRFPPARAGRSSDRESGWRRFRVREPPH